MADRLIPASLGDLKGFETGDHLTALQHMRDVLTTQLLRTPALGPAPLTPEMVKCWEGIAAAASEVANASEAKRFFEEHFSFWQVIDETRPEGLFTGYFEPELKGSRNKSREYPYPVYAKPVDLVVFEGEDKTTAGVAYGKFQDTKPVAYDTREEIDHGSLVGRAEIICYVSDIVELFFMQVQGSGRVRLDQGEVLRLGYAAKSGRAYQSIGAELVRENLMARENVTMQTIKQWIDENPEKRDALLWQNQSYVFFRVLDLPDQSRGAIGAAGIQLIPECSLAIDKTRYCYGTPVWLSTTLPNGEIFRKLMISADTGSAILGSARGDVYFGWGESAEHLAGHMKQLGAMYVLLPKRI